LSGQPSSLADYANPNGDVSVRAPNGKVYRVPRNRLAEAQQQGGQVIGG
jgi:hypothetical protein